MIILLWNIKAKRIIYLPKPYYFYRKRENSTTESKIKRGCYKNNITMALAVEKLIDVNNRCDMYLRLKALLDVLIYQHTLVKEFNNSNEEHKQKIIIDMANTINKISRVFESKYLYEAIAFGNIHIPKKLSKTDLKEIINSLKNINNQDHLKNILYKTYTKLSKDSKLKLFIKKKYLRKNI